MAHDEDYDFLFFSFSFLFLTCIYILLDDETTCTFYIILAAHTSFPFLFGFRKKGEEGEEEEALSMLSLRYHLEVMDVVVSVPRKGYM